ncbi:ethanolamine permease [Candidatus Formimonas warabiya]|uniref:Ethanolamine permease n=1 Tax=Formimonas warabiya TaxID=1761012 RepID=A0A3G1L1N3_FORW1|nr:ethanolamine permease [Candidatus Formimonas warabiya]ATW28554.1 ethanolamine permease [Candidatus Formimonas warabiya]
MASEKNTGHQEVKLERSLKPIHLWALAVGLVISGNYFGWSYGFGAGGPIGLAISTIPVIIFYATFIFCYSELATAIPHAGGPSAYARRALGPFWGYMNGVSCLVEFMFAPPAIALAVGGYIHNMVPAVPTLVAAVAAFLIFIFINFLGMKTSAAFELAVTVIALVGLAIFWAAAAPHFSWALVVQEPVLPNGFEGIMAAIPFAIWFYLAIEGGAMAAEEMLNPQKDIPKGFLSGMATLVVMMCFTLFLTAGITDYNLVSAVDYPLPAALAQVFGEKSVIVLLVNFIGLFGLIASLHGIIVGYSRQTYAMARTGYLPKFLAQVNEKHHTPHWALLVPGLVGIAFVLTGLTSMVITISVFGAVALYLISLVSFFVLRKKEPDLKRPFKVSHGYLIGGLSFVMGLFCLYSVIVYNTTAIIWVILIYAIAIAWYAIEGRKDIRPFEEEFGVLDEL